MYIRSLTDSLLRLKAIALTKADFGGIVMIFCNSCMEPYEDGDRCPKCGYSDSDPEDESLYLPYGSIVKDKYTIGMLLGTSAFGATYIGWDRKFGRKVVVKEYLPTEFATRVPGNTAIIMFADGKKQKQFHDGLVKYLEEAEKLRQLPSDNGIAMVLDSFNFNNTAYIVTEFLEGETLANRLERDDTVSATDAIVLILPIINSIQLVHSQGMIHGDICLKNIFITADGKLKLIDFAAYRNATTSLSRSLSVAVNAGYSAEEQYRSRSDLGAYTDVYALGAVLYRMITGVTPPDALERRASFEQNKRDTLKPFRGGLLQNQSAAIMNALNISIQDRTQTALAFAQELTSNKKVARRGNKIRIIDNGKLKKGIIVASVIAIFCIASTIAAFAMGIANFGDGGFRLNPVSDGMTRVPSVVGKELAQSKKLLSDAKLQVSISDKQFSDKIPADFVLLQDIKAGTIVDANTTVSLTISCERDKKLVPLVEGETIEAAKKMLESQDFVVKEESSPSLYKTEGIVFSQSVEANTEFAVGDTILLQVSNGEVIKGVAYIETVPNLTGITLSEATNKLKALATAGKNDGKPFGIFKTVNKDYSKTIPEGHIISQNLKAGTQVMTDKSFMFTISLGIHYVILPNVQHQTLANAKAMLKLKGESNFKLDVKEATDEDIAKDSVISQSPDGGNKVEFDSPVLLTVSLGPREFSMPSVEGKTRENAEIELNKNGMKNISYIEDRDDDIPTGSIISQSPVPGVTVIGRSKVELIVSIGKILRKVPNVTNISSYDAESRIENAYLKMVMREDYSNSVSSGFVISQEPVSGVLESGNEVVVTISKGRRPVEVPNVVGQIAASAEQMLIDAKVNIKLGQDDYDEDIPKGSIRSQSPAAKSIIYEGDTVVIVLSKGPKPVIVPYVSYMNENDATSALQNKRFVVQVQYQESKLYDKGKVISQNPSAYTTAPRDSTVIILVSQGIQVPDLRGLNESVARYTLSSASLSTIVNYQFSSSVPKGAVSDQSPAPHEYLNMFGIVTLTVSKGTQIPDIRGYTQANADSAIRAAGLQVNVVEIESKTVPRGQVISQNPSGGYIASAGDSVMITVSSGIKVPNVVGQTQVYAKTTLQTAGLAVSVQTASSDTVITGSVISQTPEGGTYASQGDTITITVSSGKALNTTPAAINIVNSKYSAITNNGLNSSSVPIKLVLYVNSLTEKAKTYTDYKWMWDRICQDYFWKKTT